MQQTLAQLVRAKYPGAYDDLSDQQLETSVRSKFPGVYDDLPLSTPAKPAEKKSGFATFGDVLIGALKGSGETAINLGQMLRSIPGVDEVLNLAVQHSGIPGLSGAYMPPQVSGRVFNEARQAMQPTNTAQRIGKGTEQFAELLAGGGAVGAATKGLRLGARVAAEGAAGAAMNVAQGQSATAGGVMGAAVPVAGAAFRGARSILRGAGATPVVSDAVEWGARQGIPIDAATASGAPIMRAIQGAADATPLGGIVAAQARNQTGEALTATGQRLARQVAESPQTAVSAGESIQGTLGRLVQQATNEADNAYGVLRGIEARASGEIPLMGNAPPSLSMVVDLQPVRERLKPLYDRMLRASQLAQPMGAEATALKAIDRLMKSEGAYSSLSIVDDALSDLKSVLRKQPEIGKGTGALKSTVALLDKQVMDAARRGGPEAVSALRAGREATIRKYVAADIAERLGDEPARAVGRVTARADTAIQSLRELAAVAPKELPKIGRAVIDDLLETATQEGGFKRADGLFQRWQNLGEQTKGLLFTPETKRDLDRFFLLAKRLQESPNPSMSGTITMTGGSTALIFTNPATGVPLTIGAGALSKLLHSPAGARAITTLLSTPPKSAAYASRLQAVTRALALEASQATGGSQ